jgi:hypothetical protein
MFGSATAPSFFSRYKTSITTLAAAVFAAASLTGAAAVIATASGTIPASPPPTPASPVPLTSFSYEHMPAAAKRSASSEYHVVVRGDTLTSISQKSYDNAMCWPGIYRANEKLVGANPDDIDTGWRLAIPAACDTRPVPMPAPTKRPATTAYVQHDASPPSAHVAGDSSQVAASGSSFEDCVVSRESGGDATIVNPASGAGGLFQFLPSTWADYDGYPNAESAPASVQEEYFNIIYAADGTSPWRPYDHC